jgi:DNA-binding LacI/PurR family transcriptional regulator
MNPGEERRHLKNMLDKCVEGVIVTPISTERTNVDVYNEVVARGVPLVLLGNPPAGVNAPSVQVDNVLGGTLAARYLYGLGHRDFAYITNHAAELMDERPFLSTENTERYQGFRQVLDECGIGDRLAVVEAPFSQVSEETIDGILALAPRPTALFFYSDFMAIHAIHMLSQRGIAVPGEISVAGFDDIELAALVNPPLTTITQPKREMGIIGAQKVLALIEGKSVSSVVLRPELVVRGSAAACRRPTASPGESRAGH